MKTTAELTKNKSTCETCPLHIWKHEVIMEAIAQAGTGLGDVLDENVNAMIIRWYNAGEPVWMAAGSLALILERHRIEDRADREVESLRRFIRKEFVK